MMPYGVIILEHLLQVVFVEIVVNFHSQTFIVRKCANNFGHEKTEGNRNFILRHRCTGEKFIANP